MIIILMRPPARDIDRLIFLFLGRKVVIWVSRNVSSSTAGRKDIGIVWGESAGGSFRKANSGLSCDEQKTVMGQR